MASAEAPLEHSPAYLQAYIGDRSVNVAIAFIVLQVVVVAARFYARTKVFASLAIDDFLTIPALVRSLDTILTGADIRRHVDWASAQLPSHVGPLQLLLECQQH